MHHRVTWTRRTAAVAIVIGIVLLLQARVGDRRSPETSAIAALKRIASTCLHSPCRPDATGQMALFDGETMTGHEWSGYRFEFHTGPRPAAASARFAVVATPAQRLTTPYRSFCVDDRQTIYQHPASKQPQVRDARCLDTSNPVR